MRDPGRRGQDGRGWLERNLALVTTPAILLAFAIGWTAYVRHHGISRYLLPEPLAIGRALLDLVRQPYFHDAVLVTASEVLSSCGWASACSRRSRWSRCSRSSR